MGESTRMRLLSCAIAGVAAGVLTGILLSWQLGVMGGWIFFTAAFLIWTWARIVGMDPSTTAHHALREDPGRRTFDLLVVVAALASLVGVALVLADSSSPGGQPVQAAVSIVAIFLSWGTVQTVYTQRYAELYYVGTDGGIDFPGPDDQGKPSYRDFAYLAFTIGMTYQVSDTDLTDKQVRHTALRHGLLSYLFGAVVIAATINLIGGLGH